MTLMSATAKAIAITHHGIWNGVARATSSVTNRPYRMRARPASDAEKAQTRTAGLTERPRVRSDRWGAPAGRAAGWPSREPTK
jgi:hypothetical protein